MVVINKVTLWMLLILLLNSNSSFSQTFVWPTSSAVKVGNSYGSFELVHTANGDRAFHTGIDIPAIANSDYVNAIADGDLIRVARNGLGSSGDFVFYFQSSALPNLIALYGHCDQDSRLSNVGLYPLVSTQSLPISGTLRLLRLHSLT